jgi:hypothetical protein
MLGFTCTNITYCAGNGTDTFRLCAERDSLGLRSGHHSPSVWSTQESGGSWSCSLPVRDSGCGGGETSNLDVSIPVRAAWWVGQVERARVSRLEIVRLAGDGREADTEKDASRGMKAVAVRTCGDIELQFNRMTFIYSCFQYRLECLPIAMFSPFVELQKGDSSRRSFVDFGLISLHRWCNWSVNQARCDCCGPTRVHEGGMRTGPFMNRRFQFPIDHPVLPGRSFAARSRPS